MPELVERIDVDAPPERVWAAADRLGAARASGCSPTDVRTVDGPAQRLHGRLAARTGLPLPGGRHLGVLDTMIITKWEPPRLVEVQHTGRIVRGPGIFEVLPRGEHSTFVWTEGLVPALRLARRGRLVPRPAAGRAGAASVAAAFRRARRAQRGLIRAHAFQSFHRDALIRRSARGPSSSLADSGNGTSTTGSAPRGVTVVAPTVGGWYRHCHRIVHVRADVIVSTSSTPSQLPTCSTWRPNCWTPSRRSTGWTRMRMVYRQ